MELAIIFNLVTLAANLWFGFDSLKDNKFKQACTSFFIAGAIFSLLIVLIIKQLLF